MKKARQVSSKTPIIITPVKAAVYKPDWRYAIVAALFGFLLYANTIGFGYVLDDELVIRQNRCVQQGIKGIPGLLTQSSSSYEDIKLQEYYRPLSLITFAIEQQIAPGNPHLNHFFNLLFYGLTGFVLCMLLMRLFSCCRPIFSLTITLLFLAHPLHTEVVSNIKSCDEILAFLCMSAGLYIALIALEDEYVNYRLMAVSGVLFYAALLSKETAISGILLLPAIIFYKRQFDIKAVLIYTIPFLLAALLFQLQKQAVVSGEPSLQIKDIILPYAGVANLLPTIFYILAYSVKLLALPYPQSFSYAYNQIPVAGWSSPGALAGVAIAAFCGYMVYRFIKKSSVVSFGAVVFAVCILPVLAFMWLKGEMLAERFLYSSVLGFCIILTELFFRFMRQTENTENKKSALAGTRLGVALVAGIILILYVIGTVSRNNCWHDNLSLFSHDVNVTDNSVQTHLLYGTALIDYGVQSTNGDERVKYLRLGQAQLFQAAAIYPHLPQAYAILGEAEQKLAENCDSAIYFYNRAIMEGSDLAFCYFGMGQCYEEKGKQELASYYYYTAAKRHPLDVYAQTLFEKHRNKTGLLVKDFPSQNNIDSSEMNNTQHGFDYYNKLGLEYGQKGDFANGARCLQKAAELNPGSQPTLINLANCLCGTGDYNGGINALKQVLQLNPNNLQALNNLAIVYERVGNKTEARRCKARIAEVNAR